MAEDVALLHRRDVAVAEVKIGPADRGERDLHDGITTVDDARLRNLLDPHVTVPVPTHCFHGSFCSRVRFACVSQSSLATKRHAFPPEVVAETSAVAIGPSFREASLVTAFLD